MTHESVMTSKTSLVDLEVTCIPKGLAGDSWYMLGTVWTLPDFCIDSWVRDNMPSFLSKTDPERRIVSKVHIAVMVALAVSWIWRSDPRHAF